MPRKGIDLQTVISAFHLDNRARNLSPRTQRSYADHLTWFSRWLATQNVTHLQAITSAHVRAYQVYLREERGWAPATQHIAARTLRRSFRYCQEDDWLTPAQAPQVKPPRLDETILPAFTVQEVARLIKACTTQRDRALVLCLLDTGSRASELIAWNVADVNIATGAVQLHKTKNHRARVVFLGQRARKELLKLLVGQHTEPTKSGRHEG